VTIGIAVSLPDGALFVADGRQTWPLAGGKLPEDDVDKLKQIGSSVFVISVGITQATDWAQLYLQQAFDEGCTPETFVESLEASVRSGWDIFIDSLAPDVDPDHPTMRAALIAGGFLTGEPFIAGSLCGGHANTSSTVMRKGPEIQFIVVGGEEQQSEERFKQEVEQNLQGLFWQSSQGPMNLWVDALVKAAVSVIRFVESQNLEVGGTIRYALVRQSFPVKKTVWTE